MLESLLAQGRTAQAEETSLPVDAIRTDGGTQPRSGITLDVVAEYTDVYRADPLRMPPVAVTYDGSAYWLVDGFHRLEAAKTAGLDHMRAIVEPGTQADAQWRSYAANASHGLRRTNADKERAIRAALRHANAATLSNSALAAHLGVTDKSVAKYRQEMESTSEIPKSTVRTGADGRTINTANIGAKPSPAPGAFVGGILASPEEVADAIEKHYTWRGDGAYDMKYNFLIRAKQPGAARMEIMRTLAQNRYTFIEDYDGDLLLDGIRTALQRTMQAEQDRITAEEDAARPTPPTSENPKSGNGAGLPPLDMPIATWPTGPEPKRVGPPAKNASDRQKLAHQTFVAFQAALNCVRYYEELTNRDFAAEYDAIFRMLSSGIAHMIDIQNDIGPYANPKPEPAETAANWRDHWGQIDQHHYDQLMARKSWTVDDVMTTNVCLRLMDEFPPVRPALGQRHDEIVARAPKPA